MELTMGYFGLSPKKTSFLVLAAHFFASEFCLSHAHKSHSKKRVERREAPGSWATPRGRMLPLARASGVARATGQFACANRLLRARCASRRATAVSATTVDRRSVKPALAPPTGITP